MASDEDRLRHSARRKKNIQTKQINDYKGAFALKPVANPRRQEYQRQKIRAVEVSSFEEEFEEYE